MVTVENVLAFWLDEIGPDGWYAGGEALDAKIRDRFLDTWRNASDGAFSLWLTYPSGALAYIIVTDQFPRNMFRGKADSFATDDVALAAAKCAIDKKWDMSIDEPARQFFYMPLMHSENLCDQERCVRLMKERMPETGDSNLFHAKAHREVIRQFGRFPYRSAALSRQTTPTEDAYLAQGGYGHTVQQMQELAQAS
jgi:uncharacterized protein (DUF924 family)